MGKSVPVSHILHYPSTVRRLATSKLGAGEHAHTGRAGAGTDLGLTLQTLHRYGRRRRLDPVPFRATYGVPHSSTSFTRLTIYA
jgi:hypothetical protein